MARYNSLRWNKAESYSPFDAKYIKEIFLGQHTLLIGDSIMRGFYKDLVSIIHTERLTLLDREALKDKAEVSFCDDRQIDMEPYKGERVWVQAREYHTEDHLIQFHFTTRCFKEDLDCVIAQMVRDNKYPRMVFFNSCLWDITRYHKIGWRADDNIHDSRGQEMQRKILEEYENRCALICSRLKLALPAASHVFVVLFPQCIPTNRFMEGFQCDQPTEGDTFNNKEVIRVLYVKANKLAAQIARLEGFSVIDLNYHLSAPIFEPLRVRDGIHWDNYGIRFMTQLIIMHLVNDLELHIPDLIMNRINTLFGKVEQSGDRFVKETLDSAKKSKSIIHVPSIDRKGRPIEQNGRPVYDVAQFDAPYYEFLQAELQQCVWEELSNEKKQKIKEDIEKMRVALFLQHGGILDESDHQEFIRWVQEGQRAIKLRDLTSLPQQFIGFSRVSEGNNRN